MLDRVQSFTEKWADGWLTVRSVQSSELLEALDDRPAPRRYPRQRLRVLATHARLPSSTNLDGSFSSWTARSASTTSGRTDRRSAMCGLTSTPMPTPTLHIDRFEPRQAPKQHPTAEKS